MLYQGKPVARIDREARMVIAADGTSARYDKLIIATGSTPFIIPVPGHDLPGVITYRDLDDVERMVAAASGDGRRAVVIGGGLLGLEAAAGLAMRGMAVSVVHLMDTLMERQLDPAAGELLKNEFVRRGIRVLTGANTAEIYGDGRVAGVALTDGRRIDAELVVMAVGIRPSVALAQDAGLEVGRGVVVGDTMETSDPTIFAVGECVEHRGVCYGLVAPLYEMAEVLADQLAGGRREFTGAVTSTKLKVTGIDLFSAGDFAAGVDREDIVLSDVSAGVYKRLVLKDGRIHGVVLYGDTADGAWYFKMMREGTAVDEHRDMLVFGPQFAEAIPLDPTVAAVASLVKPAGRSGQPGNDNTPIARVGAA